MGNGKEDSFVIVNIACFSVNDNKRHVWQDSTQSRQKM